MEQCTRPSSIYFAYGSNMWKDQMARRCPENRFLGIARLENWKWIISQRGYANVVQSPGDIAYGLAYEISDTDEADLDCFEGVPMAYVKEYYSATLLSPKGRTEMKFLVYVDFLRVEEDKAHEDYIYRMNLAIEDALSEGVPEDYVEMYLRPFIPRRPTSP